VHWNHSKGRTASKMARPAQITLTGGNAYRVNSGMGNTPPMHLTYHADDVAEGGGSRKCGQNCNSTLNGLHDPFHSLVFTKDRDLVLQKGGNGLYGLTTLELCSEWMFGQCYACLPLVRLQGRLEKHSQPSRSRSVTHISGKEET
jgi:hypothetical protein